MSLLPSVYSGRGISSFSALSLSSESSNLQKTPFYRLTKAAMYFFVSRLFCPSRSCSGSLADLPASTFPPRPRAPPPIPAIMCPSAAQHGGEWGPFSIPPAIYLTLGRLQVEEKARSYELGHACDGQKASGASENHLPEVGFHMA